jgi:hypothetical protein
MGRIGIIAAHKGHGKTTSVITSSKNVPDTMAEVLENASKGKEVDCSDVSIFQLDNEGEIGATSLGLQPDLHDFSDLAFSWVPLQKAMEASVKQTVAKARDGKVKTVGIDYGALVDAALDFWKQSAKGFDLWTSARDSVETLIAPLRTTPANIVLMTHLKAYDPSIKMNNATAQQLETHKAKETMRADSQDVDFVLDISQSMIKTFMRPASFVWIPRRVVESKIVGGKETKVARYWIETDASDYAPSFTRGNSPMKKVVDPRDTRTMKAMFASLDSLKGKKA